MKTGTLIRENIVFLTCDLIQKIRVNVNKFIRFNSTCSFFILCALFTGLMFSTDALADGTLYYSATDGSVRGLNMVTGTEEKCFTVFNGANPGAGRNIAYDPVTKLLWYTSTDGIAYSFNVDSLAAGPSLTVTHGADPGSGRHVFIDYKNRTLLIPITDGSVNMYNLSNQALAGTISSAFFLGANVAYFRHMASDPVRGTVWYAHTDGSFIEMNANTSTHTGRTISFAQQVGANPGAYRHFIVDPYRDLLIYSVTDGSLASIDLTTLTQASFIVSAAYFTGANPGAGRVITYDYKTLPVNSVLPSINLLLLAN